MNHPSWARGKDLSLKLKAPKKIFLGRLGRSSGGKGGVLEVVWESTE